MTTNNLAPGTTQPDVAVVAQNASQDLYAEVVTITPEMADLWWKTKRRMKNRRMKPGKIRQYSSDMLADRFPPNNDAICFDTEGKLINGHHRLQACIKAGTPFRSFVHYNIDPAAFITMDVSASRSMGDVLDLNSVDNASLIAPALNWWSRFHHGKLEGSLDLTYQEELAIYKNARPAIDSAATFINELKWKHIASPPIAMFCLLVFRLHDATRADDFMRSLSTGATGNDPDNPILLLREKLRNSHTSKYKADVIGSQMAIALIFKTWDLWLSGDKVKRLSMTKEEARKKLKGAPLLYGALISSTKEQ